MRLPVLMLLVVSGTWAAPTGQADNPFLEGLDSFLAAFEGLGLPGDPLLESGTTEPPPPPEQQEPSVEPQVAHCLGCIENIETDSVSLRKIAQVAANLLEDQLNMTEVTAVTQVYRAATQVVNGIKYFLTLELSPTTCSRPRVEGEDCVVDTAADTLLFSVEFIQHPLPQSDAELLLYEEVLPEAVAELPGLFSGPEPPPTTPPSDEAGVTSDLGPLIYDTDLAADGDSGGAEPEAAAAVDGRSKELVAEAAPLEAAAAADGA